MHYYLARGLILIMCVLSGVAAAAAPLAGVALARTGADRIGQANPSMQERLERVRAGIFSGQAAPEAAIKELHAILAIDPGSAEAHLLLGIAYRSSGSSDLMGEAVAELRQALALNPGFAPARFYLAHIYLDLGRAERAREELRTALTQAPGNPQFMALLGEAERQLKNPARSVELNTQALKVDATFAQSRYYLGLALYDLGKRDQAMSELERVVQSGPDAVDAYLSLGTLYVEAGRYDDALKVLRRGGQIDSSRPEIRIQMARAYRSKGLLDSADAQLKLARPKGTTTLASSLYQHQQIEFDLTLEQGLVRLKRDQLEEAASAFRKALSMDPNHGLANRYIAEVYLLQKRYTLASEHAALAEKFGAPLPEDKRRVLTDMLRTKTPGGGE
jgi:tetratricopeptide (TPR) repeat protein